jgi:AraC family transcriptional regulator
MPARQTHRVEQVSFGSPRFRSAEFGGLLVTDAEFPPCARLCAHIHDRTCVATTLSGRFDSRMGGRSHWSSPSMVLTEPAEERHENEFGGSGARILVIQPDSRRLETLRPVSSFLTRINHFGDVQIGLIARRLVSELARPDAVTPLVVEALALELLAIGARRYSTGRAQVAPPRWLERVRERLHDAFPDPATLAELGQVAGVHPAHLTRAFRRQFGRSVGAYQRDVRLDWAARQLEAAAPLAAIASSAGFADQSHFTRAFKRRFGRTPGAYRRLVRDRTSDR